MQRRGVDWGWSICSRRFRAKFRGVDHRLNQNGTCGWHTQPPHQRTLGAEIDISKDTFQKQRHKPTYACLRDSIQTCTR